MITVTVSGPCGSGKTTLARHLELYLRQLGHNVKLDNSVHEGHCNFNTTPSREIYIREKFEYAERPKHKTNSTLSYCTGCAIPEHSQVNLSDDWAEGDAIPDNVSVHSTIADPRKFVFIGDKIHQKRHYL